MQMEVNEFDSGQWGIYQSERKQGIVGHMEN